MDDFDFIYQVTGLNAPEYLLIINKTSRLYSDKITPGHKFKKYTFLHCVECKWSKWVAFQYVWLSCLSLTKDVIQN